MARHFFAVLGTGNYSQCVYTFKGKSFNTKYIQEAVIELIMGELLADDKITIFLTDDSRKKHWRTDNNDGLDYILTDKYKTIGIKPNDVAIPTGKNEDELMEIFSIIFDKMDNNDEIYFDITHGLRNIPMLALTIINYARVLKDIKVGGIYYGAFEAGEKIDTGKKNEFGQTIDSIIVPIFDLTSYMTIIDWTLSAELFIKYGNGNMIKDLFNAQKKSASDELRPQLSKLTMAINGIVDITNCLETSRGKFFDNRKSSIRSAYKYFSDGCNKIDNNNENLIRPLAPLFRKIKESTEIFDIHTNFDTGMAAIKWAIEKNLTQQGLTALAETIKTYVCNIYNLDENSRFYRDDVAQFAIQLKSKSYKNDVVIIKSLVKKYNSNSDNKLMMSEIEYINKINEIISTLPKEIIDISNNTTDARNNINHFGYQKSECSYENLQKQLQNCYNKLKEIVKNKGF